MNTIYKIFALAVLVCAGQQAMAQISFTQTTYPLPSSGGFPGTINGTFIKAADFNNDGWQDLAMVDAGGPLRVLLNTGNGLFAPQQSYQILPVSDGAVNMDLGDFNEDGNIDIVVSPSNAFAFGVGAGIFYGTSTGTFNPIVFPSAPVCQSIIVGDFNNDNHDDILSTFGIFGSVLLGDGAGNFTTNALPAGTTGINMSILDLNQDGNSDIIHQNSGAVWYSSLGDGNGVLTLFTGITTGDTYAIAGDLNGDNIPDLISKNCCNIRVYAGLGDGSFQTTPFAAVVPANNIGQILDVKIGDINNDGNNDIIETHRASTGSSRTFVGVFLGDGAGNFGASTLVAASPPATFQDFTQFELADLNNDGKIDIAAMDRGSSIVHILSNSTPFPPTITSFSPTSGPIGTTVTITGTNFDPVATNNDVEFNGVSALTPSAASLTSLTVIVPAGATTGPISVTTVTGTGTSSTDFVVTSCVPVSERNALTALYNSTDGPNWGTANQNWLSDDITTWFGVKVEGCHVTEIDIYSLTMAGSLPVELKDLPFLNSLTIYSHLLGGTIPKEIGTLSNLRYLSIVGRNISGTIPVEISNLIELRVLALEGGHSFTGPIPSEFSNLINLEDLSLHGGLYVDEISSGTTGLTGNIPPGVASLPNLKYLYLEENQLSGPIPSSFGPSLIWLDLGGNQFTGNIPSSLGSLTNLFGLNLYRNQLTGSIPSSLGNLQDLAFINIRSNNLTGLIPSTFQNLTKMQRFTAYNNQLEGEIPDAWGASIDWELRIDNNKISKIPKFTKPFYFLAQGLKVENNALDFGSLELNVGGMTLAYTYTPQANLPGGVVSAGVGVTLTIPFTTGGTQNSYQWYKDGVIIPGATSQQYSKANAQFTDAGSYTVQVTNTLVTGLTLTSDPFVVTITSCTPPSPPTAANVSRCGSGTVTLTANGATGTQEYRWYDVVSGGTSLSSLATFTILNLTTTTPYYVSIFDVATSCESNRTQVDAIVNTPPAAPGVTGNSGCSGTSISVSATGGSAGQYRWYTIATGGTPDAAQTNDTFVSPTPLIANTSFWVSINNGTCESNRTEVIATVIPLPTAPNVQPVNPVCPGSDVTLTATGGIDGQYRWYEGATIIPGEVNSTLMVSNITGPRNFQAALNDGICESNKNSVSVTLKNCTPPVIAPVTATAFLEGEVEIDLCALISDPENDLDLTTLRATGTLTSGAPFTISGCTLSINYAGVPFPGTDALTIEVCDLTGLCTVQTITIELGGDINVFNAVSPNGDGKNEFLTIQYIDILPETQNNNVFIYNRWGDEVFSVNNYNNADRVFKGDNKNGNKLPTGSYYYKIVFPNGKKPITGFLELKY